ncbi:hypothetical protein SKAU_G00179490 [Synaphobranchus kaupii]|uniref:Uncharacterized protein n=1 Tax=Synaphobranchus kaupii TaxID=118154 RepID=A0A9Q1IZD5_SYNKA|nr:hypothetical protein SKAU_G00179490 [Synaphobranchus kaupii]
MLTCAFVRLLCRQSCRIPSYLLSRAPQVSPQGVALPPPQGVAPPPPQGVALSYPEVTEEAEAESEGVQREGAGVQVREEVLQFGGSPPCDPLCDPRCSPLLTHRSPAGSRGLSVTAGNRLVCPGGSRPLARGGGVRSVLGSEVRDSRMKLKLEVNWSRAGGGRESVPRGESGLRLLWGRGLSNGAGLEMEGVCEAQIVGYTGDLLSSSLQPQIPRPPAQPPVRAAPQRRPHLEPHLGHLLQTENSL